MGLINYIRKKVATLLRSKTESITEYVEIDGNRFSVIDPTKLPNIRRIPFFLEAYKREWGIDKNDLLAFLEFMKRETQFPEVSSLEKMNALLAEKLKHNYSLLSVIESILREDYQYKPYLKAASFLILLDGEDPNKIDPVYTKRKMDLCQSNQDIEAFFLTTIFCFQASTKSLSDMSRVSSWYPSKNLKLMENSMYKKIGTTIYGIGST
jgi:hypothetical protein